MQATICVFMDFTTNGEILELLRIKSGVPVDLFNSIWDIRKLNLTKRKIKITTKYVKNQ